jgi:hypothetical protein
MQAEELTAEFSIAGILDFVETEHGLVRPRSRSTASRASFTCKERI